MIRRLLYLVFFAMFGWVFAIPKWILMGTRGSRQRKKMIRLQKQQLRETRKRP